VIVKQKIYKRSTIHYLQGPESDSGRWLPPTAEVTAEVSPARSYPELFRVTGPCFGPRTCGRGISNSSKRRSSQSGFPLLTPTMHAGQDLDGRVDGLEEMCTLHAVIMLWVLWVAMSGESFHAYTRFIRRGVSTVY